MNQSLAGTTQFDVHLFAVVRVKIPNVVASSHREAIAWAVEHSGDLYERFVSADSDFAEEFSHFLVDVVGDQQYEQSQWFYCEQEPIIGYLRRLVRWHDGDPIAGDTFDKIMSEVRQALTVTV